MKEGRIPANQHAKTTRRRFLKTSTAAVAGGLALGGTTPRNVHAAEEGTLRIGLVGCGGRGTGAAVQALTADPNTQLVAMGEAFDDRLQASLRVLQKSKVADRVQVDPDHLFAGLDAYKKVLASDIDIVLLATPPHFRPEHLKAAIEAGKHVFAEKPVAVDAPGVRSVLETTALAKTKNLAIVSGLCWRYEDRTIELMKRLHDGAIGDIFSMEAIRYGGGVWTRPRKPEMTEMQYQMTNWYYFTWLSGDFNVEQHVHELDKVAWLLGDRYPVSCIATGGRLVRTGADQGHIYDHFASVFEYDDGAKFYASSRHQPGCARMNTVKAIGTKGMVDAKARAITGQVEWQDTEKRTQMHQREHDAMYAALRRGEIINNGEYMARSTLMGIMQRMSAYTGQTITWEMAMNSQQRLGPTEYTWDTPIEVPEVALPGKTKFS